MDNLNFKWKFKRFFEDWSDPQPDFMIQPKARVLFYMERESTTHHIKEDLELEHLIASTQSRKYSEVNSKYSKDSRIAEWRLEAIEALDDAFRSTWRM